MAGTKAGSRVLAAVCLALPTAAVIWFEIVYLAFGLTGQDPPALHKVLAAVAAFAGALAWPLHGTVHAAQVVRRSCRLGMLASVLMPVVALAVLFVWDNASGRRDLGMGGLMLYSMPFVTLAAALVLGLLFVLCDKLAAKRLRAEEGG